MDFNLIVLISFRILLIFFRNISLLRSPTYIILIHFRAKEQENTHTPTRMFKSTKISLALLLASTGAVRLRSQAQ